MIKIRSMEAADIASVASIEEECFSLPWTKENFADSRKLPHAVFLVAVEEEVLGYVGMYRSFEEGEITNVAVSSKARRRHVASSLLQELHLREKEAGVERILLEVRESNAAAIGLYEKLGYQKIGVRKGFYDAPKEDAILMQVQLD